MKELNTRGILGFGGWVGASPQISKGFLFGGGGGIPPDLIYIFSEVPMVILLISDLKCHSDLECQNLHQF